ncbi:hypothetical protein B4080_6173 [Bacillus cereus]|nr:hypothetical protein B4080_6173 [Bacillus cereus]
MSNGQIKKESKLPSYSNCKKMNILQFEIGNDFFYDEIKS